MRERSATTGASRRRWAVGPGGRVSSTTPWPRPAPIRTGDDARTRTRLFLIYTRARRATQGRPARPSRRVRPYTGVRGDLRVPPRSRATHSGRRPMCVDRGDGDLRPGVWVGCRSWSTSTAHSRRAAVWLMRSTPSRSRLPPTPCASSGQRTSAGWILLGGVFGAEWSRRLLHWSTDYFGCTVNEATVRPS